LAIAVSIANGTSSSIPQVSANAGWPNLSAASFESFADLCLSLESGLATAQESAVPLSTVSPADTALAGPNLSPPTGRSLGAKPQMKNPASAQLAIALPTLAIPVEVTAPPVNLNATAPPTTPGESAATDSTTTDARSNAPSIPSVAFPNPLLNGLPLQSGFCPAPSSEIPSAQAGAVTSNPPFRQPSGETLSPTPSLFSADIRRAQESTATPTSPLSANNSPVPSLDGSSDLIASMAATVSSPMPSPQNLGPANSDPPIPTPQTNVAAPHATSRAVDSLNQPLPQITQPTPEESSEDPKIPLNIISQPLSQTPAQASATSILSSTGEPPLPATSSQTPSESTVDAFAAGASPVRAHGVSVAATAGTPSVQRARQVQRPATALRAPSQTAELGSFAAESDTEPSHVLANSAVSFSQQRLSNLPCTNPLPIPQTNNASSTNPQTVNPLGSSSAGPPAPAPNPTSASHSATQTAQGAGSQLNSSSSTTEASQHKVQATAADAVDALPVPVSSTNSAATITTASAQASASPAPGPATVPNSSKQDLRSGTSAESPANTPAATELPPAPASNPVQMAQMISRASQSEMRIGINTAAFGSVEVRAVVHANDVGVLIGSERGDLRSLLSTELPGVSNSLQQQNLRLTQVSFHQQGFNLSSQTSSGGTPQQPRSFAAKAGASRMSPLEVPSNEPSSASEIQANSGHAGLNILA